MLELFRRNLFINSLLLLPYTILVRIESLLHADRSTTVEHISPFVSWIYELVPSTLTQNILACILIFFQAVYINRIVVKHRIASEITLFPGLIYIILVSLLPQYTYLSPVLIANTFILMAFSEIFKIYKRPFVMKQIFNSGFMISIAAIIYLPYIIYILAGIIGLAIIRSFKTKEILQYLSGIVIPVFLYGSWVFYKRHLVEKMGSIYSGKLGFPSHILNIDMQGYLGLAAITVILLYCFFSYSGYLMKKSIQVQKKIDILFWLSFFAVVSILIYDHLDYDHLLMLAIPLSILLSMSLIKINNTMIAELLHLTVLIGIGLFHFGLVTL